jgi:hypothetical protein
MDCVRCGTEKKEIVANGKQIEICLHVGCLIDRWLEQYEGCAHQLETIGENLLECKHCGMNATPSYKQ